eukprot:gene35210-42648_t
MNVTADVQTPLSRYTGLTSKEVDENVANGVANAVVFADKVVGDKRQYEILVSNEAVHAAASNAYKILRYALPDPNVVALAARTGVDLDGEPPAATLHDRITALESELGDGPMRAPDVPNEQLTVKQLLLRQATSIDALRQDFVDLRQEVGAVQQAVSVISVKVDNGLLRAHNGQVGGQVLLEPLARETPPLGVIGALPLGATPPLARFPVPFTKDNLHSINSTAIDDLLQLYGLTVIGNVQERRRRLLIFLGVTH